MYGTRLLVGERTAEMVASEMVTRPLDLVRVKGKKGTMTVHELLGEQSDVSPAQRAAMELYAQALELYWTRDFIAAGDRFADARAEFAGGDSACDVMLQRCVWFHGHPPDEEWDGAFTMKTK